MAGTAKDINRGALPSDPAIPESIRAIVDDLEKLRAASVIEFMYQVENLAANGDIAARAVYRARVALTIQDVCAIFEAAGVGIAANPNDAVITLRNITEGVDIATITLTANPAANSTQALTITGANADIAAGDILGIVVTTNGTADLPAFSLHFAAQPQTIDAAGDLLGFKVND